MSGRLLANVTGASLALVCALAQSAEPAWEAQRPDIQRAIEAALDAREAAMAAGRQPPPTVIKSGSIAGWDDADLVALAQLIDERAALRERETPRVASQTGWKDKDSVSTDPCPGREAVCIDTVMGKRRAVGSLEALNPGVHDAVAAPSEWNFQLLTGKDSSRVSLKMDFSDTTVDVNFDGVVQSSSLVLSAPLNKDDDQGTDLIGLGGLANDFQAEYTYSRIRVPMLGEEAEGRPAFFDMARACQDLGMPMDECDYDRILEVAEEKRGTLNTTPRPDGEARWTPEFILDRFVTDATAHVMGYRIGAGYDKFSFFDPNNLAKRKTDEVPWGVGAHYGRLSGGRFIAVGFDYQRDFKPADKVTACLNNAAGPVVECVTGSLGEPAFESQHLLWTEGRWLIGEAGVSARVTHDLKSGDWELGVPIYFFHDADGFLSGGLRLGWNTEDKFTAGIFVGVPFQFKD